jgi:hypothetical protein
MAFDIYTFLYGEVSRRQAAMVGKIGRLDGELLLASKRLTAVFLVVRQPSKFIVDGRFPEFTQFQ